MIVTKQNCPCCKTINSCELRTNKDETLVDMLCPECGYLKYPTVDGTYEDIDPGGAILYKYRDDEEIYMMSVRKDKMEEGISSFMNLIHGLKLTQVIFNKHENGIFESFDIIDLYHNQK